MFVLLALVGIEVSEMRAAKGVTRRRNNEPARIADRRTNETERPTECGSTENTWADALPLSLANSDRTSEPKERETTMFNAFRPSESLFPTETIRPTESLDDGGIIIDYFPTETIRPMESLHHFEVLI